MNFVFNILFKILISVSLTKNCLCYEVKARCGQPGLPPSAKVKDFDSDKTRFDDHQEISVVCKRDTGFPGFSIEEKCVQGKWETEEIRCSKYVDTQAIHLDQYDCSLGDQRLLVSHDINQTSNVASLPLNSFHRKRIPKEWNNWNLTALSNCYNMTIDLSKKSKISFLYLHVWYINNNFTNLPTVEAIVSDYRTCRLRSNHSTENSFGFTIGFHFYCDIKSKSDYELELNNMSDKISIKVNTSFVTNIRLSAVYIGELYKTMSDDIVRPDCGRHPQNSTALDVIDYGTYTLMSCNQSFTDLNERGWTGTRSDKTGNPLYKYNCDFNGQWFSDKNKTPICLPSIHCDSNQLIQTNDNSVVIEEFGNVYYFNESQWFAINDSYVKYKCVDESAFMSAKNVRVCMKNGKWSGISPICNKTGLSLLTISGILLTILLFLFAIIYVVFRLLTKRFEDKLEVTRNVIEEQSRKRISHEIYTDAIYDNLDTEDHTYDDVDRSEQTYLSMDKEYTLILSPNENRYQSGTNVMNFEKCRNLNRNTSMNTYTAMEFENVKF